MKIPVFVFPKPIQIVAVLILFAALIPGRSSSAKMFQKNSTVMGTVLEVTVSAEDEAASIRAFDAVEAEMRRVEEEMSEWKDSSPISEVNRQAGKKAVKVPRELFNVIEASLKISAITGGAFDISWAAMRGLWDFRPGHERVPTENELKERIGLVNYRDIETDPVSGTVFLRKPGMAIGLGGIAKGYAVDKAMQTLADSGIKDAIVKAGGDIRVQGRGEGGPWEVGIRDPRDRTRLAARLTLSNISISTSGDYERFFIKDGALYHHIIDPRTGLSAKGVRSVTVLGPDTMTTDALSTAIFVLGPDEGLKLAATLPGIEAVIIDASGRLRSTPGIQLR